MTVPPGAVQQRLAFLTSGGVWSCAWCAAELTNGTITHRDDCRFIAEVRAAERDRIRQLALRQSSAPLSVQSPVASQALREFADLLGGDL